VPDLRAEIANLPLVGERFSDHYASQSGKIYRNHIAFTISRTHVDLFQHPVVFDAFDDIKQQFAHTTTGFVRAIEPHKRRFAERIIEDLCVLLSFATLSEVRPFEYHYAQHSRGWSTSGLTLRMRPPIEADGAAVRRFVEQTWPAFRRLKGKRQFNVVIHYLTLGDHPLQPLEARLLLTFVALENLKATWAHAKGIPFVKGFFRKPNANGLVTKNSYRFTFEELVSGMLAEVDMYPSLRRIVKVRNNVVHFGLTERSFKSSMAYYEQTRAIIHEYMLRLLSYRGPFLDYRTLTWRQL
jgi:hypothetical protein